MSASIFSGLEYNGYGMIMADCPWLFKNWSKKGEGRNALAHYECMEIDEIKALPVRFLAAKDCCLFMWATNPMVDQQIDLMKAWGFKFKTMGSWEKVHASGKQCFGGGYILRSSNEPYIIGTVGKPKFSHSVRSSFRGLRREHSRKPEEGCAHAEALVPGVKRLDLFSRQRRPGWDNWGNEADKFEEKDYA